MTDLNIKERRVGDVTVLDMSGEVRIGGSSVALRDAIRRLLEDGQNQLLLNLAGISFIDSSGLGELISGHIALDETGGQIKLLHLTHRVRNLMTITNLLTVFDVYESESEALDSFQSRALDLGNYPPVLVKEADRTTLSLKNISAEGDRHRRVVSR